MSFLKLDVFMHNNYSYISDLQKGMAKITNSYDP